MADFGQDIQNQANQLQRIVAETRTEVYSDDYAVRVVVGPGGSVHDVEVTSRATRHSGEALGELIVEQLRVATRQMNVELTARLAEAMGEGSALVAPTAEELGDIPSADEVRRLRQARRDEAGEEW